jgi:cytochrome o ubiquinol oxidase subunit 2
MIPTLVWRESKPRGRLVEFIRVIPLNRVRTVLHTPRSPAFLAGKSIARMSDRQPFLIKAFRSPLPLAFALSGCSTAVLNPVGPVGGADRTILLDSLAIMLVIVVPTIICGWAFAWWFRASNKRAQRLPNFAYSGSIELVVWSIPLLTILLLGGVIWVGSHQLDPAEPIASPNKTLEVQVVSLDWKWLFIYPDQGVASVNRLVIPVGTPAHFTLTSASVMNAFFIPRLGSMIYTMNGMADHLNLEADKPGVYFGESSHFSGDGFPGMHFAVDAVRPADFAAWTARVKSAGPTLDTASYTALEKQSIDVRPFTYGSATPGLFQTIVNQSIAPAPGPSDGPQPDVRPKTVADR